MAETPRSIGLVLARACTRVQRFCSQRPVHHTREAATQRVHNAAFCVHMAQPRNCLCVPGPLGAFWVRCAHSAARGHRLCRQRLVGCVRHSRVAQQLAALQGRLRLRWERGRRRRRRRRRRLPAPPSDIASLGDVIPPHFGRLCSHQRVLRWAETPAKHALLELLGRAVGLAQRVLLCVLREAAAATQTCQFCIWK